MSYIQLSIEAGESSQEVLIAQLSALEATGFEQTDTHLIAYFNEDAFPSYAVNEVLKKFVYHIQTVKEQNWNALWEDSFQPVVVDQFCAIRAHFHQSVLGVQHEIIITPKMSFGTGHHATTYLMLHGMKSLDFKGKNVLDFGTGTGVLAILAEKLGAAKITAMDNDKWSFENVQENIQLNRCSKVKALHTDQIPRKELYDIILANITKSVLLSYMGLLKSCLNSNGLLLLSGIFQEDKPAMVAAAQNWGMKLVAEEVRENWLSLRFAS